jgi:ParB-like chromosome segregation protein Spo0J
MKNEQTALSLEDLALTAKGSPLQLVTHAEFPVADLPEVVASTPPTSDFIESVRAPGRVIYPILLVRVNGALMIKEGKRRTQAARFLKLVTVPAIELKLDSMRGSVLGLMLNQARASNPIAELAMITELLVAGADEGMISSATRMPIGRIRQRLRLQKLDPELRAHADRGEISTAVAQATAKLAAPDQRKVLRQYRKDGKVSLEDVKHVRRATATKAILALPADMFAPESGQVAALPAWRTNVRKLLAEALANVPAGPDGDAVRAAIRNASEIAVTAPAAAKAIAA